MENHQEHVEDMSISEAIVLPRIAMLCKQLASGQRTPEQLSAFINGTNPFADDVNKVKDDPVSVIKRQIRFAKKILGYKNVLGPGEIKRSFDIELSSEQIPLIPFTREELMTAKRLRQFLVLRVDKMADEQPLTMKNIYDYCQSKKTREALDEDDWYKNEEFYTMDIPRVGWHLVSQEPIKKSFGEHCLNQTQALADYLADVFGSNLPSKYQQAVDEFKAKRKNIDALELNWQEKAKRLSNLSINQLCRRLPVEEHYDTLLYFLSNNIKLLRNKYDWTFRLGSGGFMIILASVGSDNIDTYRYFPDSLDIHCGVCFSRGF